MFNNKIYVLLLFEHRVIADLLLFTLFYAVCAFLHPLYLFKLKLSRVKLIVFAFLCNKVVVVASLNDFAVFKHHNGV